jgi:hypothetical protein
MLPYIAEELARRFLLFKLSDVKPINFICLGMSRKYKIQNPTGMYRFVLSLATRYLTYKRYF